MIFPRTKRALEEKQKTPGQVSQVLFFRLEKQTSKNVADTTFKACNTLRKRLHHTCFTVNIAKFLRTAFFSRTPLVAPSVKGYECNMKYPIII